MKFRCPDCGMIFKRLISKKCDRSFLTKTGKFYRSTCTKTGRSVLCKRVKTVYPKMKVCAECGENKPLTEYWKNKRSKNYPDGHWYICRICMSRTMRPRIRKEQNRKRCGNTSVRDPIKSKANYLLKLYVKKGRIKKPNRCQCCGQEFPLGKIHGHHPDYSKPLEVLWLCHKCHMTQHRLVPIEFKPRFF